MQSDTPKHTPRHTPAAVRSDWIDPGKDHDATRALERAGVLPTSFARFAAGALARMDAQRIAVGDLVVVQDGPFAGRAGILHRITDRRGGARCAVELHALGLVSGIPFKSLVRADLPTARPDAP